MVEVSEFLNYPITITDEEFEKATSISIKEELDADEKVTIRDWLDAAHESVYNLIYSVGGKDFKDRLIKNNIEKLEPVLKRAICTQIKYMLDANGDYGSADVSSSTADGQTTIVSNKIIAEKVAAPKLYSILSSVIPNLVLGVNNEQSGIQI